MASSADVLVDETGTLTNASWPNMASGHFVLRGNPCIGYILSGLW